MLLYNSITARSTIMILLFVRHCRTDYNIKNLWCGLSDIDISANSINDMPNLIEQMKNYKVDKIYCSPLKRAKKTAELINENLGVKIDIEPLITERNFGSLEGKQCTTKDKNDLASWIFNTDLNANAEKIQDMYFKRIKKFFDKLTKDPKNKNKTFLIVSHSWVYRLLLFYLSNETKPELIKIPPKSLYLYKFEI